uniref:Uncharacterized protein n=1 Tax=Populus trichocarpa TaxID=3694 RepID=A0A2K1WPZ3_POPTR
MYSRLGNDAQVCELWKKVDCPSDAVKFQKLIDKERVYDFLAGLNIEYNHIRDQVLRRMHFPSLRQTYSHVQQEKSRRNALLHLVTHERKTSWQLHGHPSRGRGGKRIGFPRSQALVSKITRTLIPDGQSNTSTLSKKEIQTLRHQMAKLDPPSLSNFAHVDVNQELPLWYNQFEHLSSVALT